MVVDHGKNTIVALDQCRTTLDPIAAVVIRHVAELSDGRAMDMAAQHGIHPVAFRIMRRSSFEFPYEAASRFREAATRYRSGRQRCTKSRNHFRAENRAALWRYTQAYRGAHLRSIRRDNVFGASGSDSPNVKRCCAAKIRSALFRGKLNACMPAQEQA
jgi:hypothetical protein